MTLEKLKEHCKRQMGMYGGNVSTSAYLEHSLVLNLINEHENRAKHDSELLDKVAEKLKTDIEKYWYRSELDMGSENVNCLIDEVINELKAEVN